MPTMGEAAVGRRLALVLATGSYADPALAKLWAPGQDASDLANVLKDAAVGGFEVETVLDAPADSLRRRVAQFCGHVRPSDLVLVYLSCHGVLDDRGRLYYATVDTDRALLSATAVSSVWLNEQLEDCRCRRQILVLDCCHSGAFAKGAKGDGDLALRERFEGRGRVVLTGSRATEYSFERNRVVGDGVSSVFTSALVEGLRSGEADQDGDGKVTVSELYDYVYQVVRTREARQTPTLWAYGAEGDLLVAHNPHGAIVKPAALPQELMALLESARPRVREGAVGELADLLGDANDPGRALSAREQLERVAAEDVPSVAAAARAALQENPLPSQPPPAQLGAQTSSSPAPATAQPRAGRPPFPRRRRTLAISAGAILAVLIAIAAALLAHGGGRSLASGVIAVSGSPRGVAVGEGATWVARYDDGEVSRIDGTSGTKQTIAVGPHPGKIVAGEGSVWVGVEDGRKLVRIDPNTHTAVKRVTVDIEGCDCAITELAIAHGMLWVGSKTRRTITPFDLRTGEQAREPYHPGEGFKGVFAVDGNAVWAVGTDDRSPPTSGVIRIDPNSGALKRIPLRLGSYFNGVAYGQGKVWIADAANARNVVSAFDPPTESVITDIKVGTGITDDDIAVAAGAVIVWDPDGGWLTRIDAREMQVVRAQQIHGYQTRQSINRESSDLAIDGHLAWVTDPTGNTVYKIED